MTEHTLKVVIKTKDLIENFYVKHHVADSNHPQFEQFKKLSLSRNMSFDLPSLRILWIDDDEDEILMRFDDDFQTFLDKSRDKKVFFMIDVDLNNKMKMTTTKVLLSKDEPDENNPPPPVSKRSKRRSQN